MRLLCLGFGYCAARYAEIFGRRFESIIGTSRNPKSREGVTLLGFDGGGASTQLAEAIHRATHLLVSAAPTASGDPFLSSLAPTLAAAPKLEHITYLSSLGVYGDHDGAWIDETTDARPLHARGHARLDAEHAWHALGVTRSTPVAVLRLAGIYGPGQNMFVRMREGRAHRIDKPGHVFNRIHVDDIARTIDAAMTHRANGVFNVCDDEPTDSGTLVLLAAQLLGVEPPPVMSWHEAQQQLSPMARSFYDSCNRVRNDKIKHELGVNLAYPTYREGLQALFASEEARG